MDHIPHEPLEGYPIAPQWGLIPGCGLVAQGSVDCIDGDLCDVVYMVWISGAFRNG